MRRTFFDQARSSDPAVGPAYLATIHVGIDLHTEQD